MPIRVFIAIEVMVWSKQVEVMSTNERGWALRAEDIPGASLGGRDACTLTIPALKRWLQCRAAPTKGKKAELVER